jgi:hypothetical protein
VQIDPRIRRDDIEANPSKFPASERMANFSQKRPWTKHLMGYPRYSAFIASDEDKSTTIFRRFERLSARNLLYLESELAELEAEQDRLDEESSKFLDLQMSAQSWDLLYLQATSETSELGEGDVRQNDQENNLEEKRANIQAAAQERLHLALRIREVLRTYRKFRYSCP